MFTPHASQRTSLPARNLCPPAAASPLRSRFAGPASLLLMASLLLSTTLTGCKKKTPNPEAPPPSSSAASSSSTPGSSSAQTGDNSEQALGKDQSGSLADRLNAIQSGAADGKQDNKKPLPDWKPMSGTGMEIPLATGLVVDSIILSENGDLENIETTTGVNATTITKSADDEHAKTGKQPPQNPKGPHENTGTGTILLDVSSVASSNHLVGFFKSGATIHIPYSTDRGVSTDTLKQLRAGKTTEFWVATVAESSIAAGFAGYLQPTPQIWVKGGNIEVYPCNLERVEPTDLAVPMLVNDAAVQLPALHAKCKLDTGEENHFYILDQLSNPIFLYTVVAPNNGDRSQTIKITFGNPNTPNNNLEKKLQDKQPVDIYGIYFDFNSAAIKPESEAVLKQISDVMHKNPDWKLSVSGHTDNIGNNEANMTLSKARAAAVKDALVKEYHIAPDRLVTDGFGASQPIDDNKKPEGRARNRRVVLQRL